LPSKTTPPWLIFSMENVIATEDATPKNLRMKTIAYENLIWLDIAQPFRDDIEYLKKNYPFHELELEDCLKRVHRPSIDEHEKYIFMILQFPVFNRMARVTVPSQVSVFMGADYLITLHDGNLPPLVELAKMYEQNPGLRAGHMADGLAHLLYHILDSLVEYCFPILNKIGDNINLVEERVFKGGNRKTVYEVSALRRDIISFRRIIRSQSEVFELLGQRPWPGLRENQGIYFGDLAQHSRKIRDELDDYKEVIEALSDTHNTLASFRINTVVKALTIVSTIMLPLTLIASIFGMHLDFLPLGQSPEAFLIIIAAMGIIAVAMVLIFWRRRWL
jgi:magnesium transporter